MAKKILITGGAGFVGSQLGYQLAMAGNEVILLDNMQYGYLDNLVIDGKTFAHLVVKDIRDPSTITLYSGVDTVFHMAAISALPTCQSEPCLAFDINTSGTAQVLEFARQNDVRRVIFSSTSSVYENSETLLMKESDPINPDLVYSVSKANAESICRLFAYGYSMDIVVCRFFNVYGAHQDIKRVSPPFTGYIARELAKNRQPIIFNNREDVVRDYIYIDDVINILRCISNSDTTYRAEIFNLGTGNAYSMPELYSKMLAISGKSIEPIYGDPMKFWDKYPVLYAGNKPFNKERVTKEVYKCAKADVSKTQKEFGYIPKVSIDEGLKRIWQYMCSVADQIV
jgi:nucleoside-diphosphate-sugar epimerase